MAKSFTSNTSAVMQFISTPEPVKEEAPKEKSIKVKQTKPKVIEDKNNIKSPSQTKTEPHKVKREEVKEKKDKQLLLLVKTSTLDKLTMLADEEGRSRNDYINRVLEEHIKGVK